MWHRGHQTGWARLAPDAAFEATRAEVEAFGARIKERWPPPPGANQLTFSGDIVPFLEARVNPVARTSMLALFGAVVLVVLIATANLAGLLLARGATRHREAAIRSSLGAGHARLLRQLLTESLSLATLGGIAGIVIAWLGVDLLGAWLADAIGTSGARSIEFFDPTSVSIDWRVLVFTAGLTGGVGVACGIFPAWQAARIDPNASLRGTSAGATGSRGLVGSGRGGLIIVQVGVALVLLSGTSLMMRSLVNLQRVDLGYDTENLLTALYSLTPAEESAGVDPSTFHIDFLERVRALPGVTAATMGEVPMGGPTWRTIVLGSEGRPELTPEMHLWTRLQPVADGHLTILGADLLEGRDIERSDGPETERVVVLNRMAADELFPGASPLGRRIQLPWEGYSEPGATVVGVVEDLQLGEPSQPLERQAYVAIRQAPQLQNGLMVRTSMEASEVFPAVRATLAELNPSLVLTSTMTMEERAAGATARSRAVTMLLGVFSAASLLLVAAGLYGTVAFTVARRTSELGLRASLGAGRYALATLVLRRGLGVTIAGIGAGLVGTMWATRFLEGILFGATGADTATLVGTSVTLFAVALVACYVPARRAMRIDPMVALRTD